MPSAHIEVTWDNDVSQVPSLLERYLSGLMGDMLANDRVSDPAIHVTLTDAHFPPKSERQWGEG